ncbi:hypothetical protein SAMN05216302_102615 [Nitrosomonas aestuarii]|uniref:DUF4340 domain-containing protein n=1 Tax=Nitrosomonas aestuarii TaxID=52441 RepID=A0A1I4E7K6_9PROT|nr:DUF4340 domain-containing protein [Nitrosomonas aestuarii]SFL01139.1 hypothetical protein SAMN05216302_102615 [Nitrosomonas aestuarii]
MTYHSQLNLIMLVTVIGLAVFLYLTPRFQSESDEAYSVSLRKPESVQTIRIVRHGQEAALQRIAGIWHLVQPYSARADTALVEKILHVLSANSRQRFPLKDPEGFSLDHPGIELYFDNDHFVFGGLAPVTNEQYLAINDHIYLVSPRYAIWIPASPLDLVSAKLLADNEIPVQFELDGVVIRQQNGQWDAVSENSGSLTHTLLESWANLWRFNQATELATDLRDHSDIQTVITIILQDGRQIRIDVFKSNSGAVFLRSGEQVGYYFSDSVSRRLLSPYAVKAD